MTSPATTIRPLILVGVGRSGSTALHRLLAQHPRLAWLSGLSQRYPQWPLLDRAAMRTLDLPLVGPPLHRRLPPAECYGLWERMYPGFSRPPRDLTAADVPPGGAARAVDFLGPLCTSSRDRLLLKITGWPRIGFLQALFPEARFIHLVRDGRAVAHSLLHIDWWDGRKGPEGWRLGPLSPVHEALWAAHGSSLVALAGLYWRILMEAMETAQAQVTAGSVLTIRYESLCAHPSQALEKILAFADLDNDPALVRHLARRPLRNTNGKWLTGLDAQQKAHLNTILAPMLAAYGYPVKA